MSTILDALKRVQRDREQGRPQGLRESVTAPESTVRSRKRRRRQSPLVRVALLLALAAGGGVFGYTRAKAWFGGAQDRDLLELALAAPPPQRGLGELAPAAEPEPRTVPEPEPRTVPEPLPSYPLAQGAPPRPARVERRLMAEAMPEPTPATSGEPAPDASAPAPAREVQRTASREPISRPAVRTYPTLPRRARLAPQLRQPAAPPEPEAPRDALVARDPNVPDVARALGVTFPPLRVTNVTWHPDPTRRSASVKVEDTELADAREGDIVKGVEVTRIEPGAVQFKLGGALKTVRIGP